MPKKITEIVRPSPKLKATKIPLTAEVVRDAAVKPSTASVKGSFENKAGKYELIRIDGDQAVYSFTNHQQRTVDATMPVLMWQRMQARADAALRETA